MTRGKRGVKTVNDKGTVSLKSGFVFFIVLIRPQDVSVATQELWTQTNRGIYCWAQGSIIILLCCFKKWWLRFWPSQRACALQSKVQICILQGLCFSFFFLCVIQASSSGLSFLKALRKILMIYKNHHLVICTFQQSHKWQKRMTSQRLHKYFMMTTTCVDHRIKRNKNLCMLIG